MTPITAPPVSAAPACPALLAELTAWEALLSAAPSVADWLDDELDRPTAGAAGHRPLRVRP